MSATTAASGLIHYPCTVCCKATSMWCSRCQEAWYCCADHLQNDWSRHRKECKPNNDASPLHPTAVPAPLPLKPIDVSAILFVPGDERARFIVVSCQPSPPAQGMCPIPRIQEFFAHGTPDSVVLTQGLNNEALRFPLQLWYCPTSLANRTPVNRAIQRITSGKADRPWCGPVIVLKYNGSRRQGYTDAGSNDLPALSSYFLAYK